MRYTYLPWITLDSVSAAGMCGCSALMSQRWMSLTFTLSHYLVLTLSTLAAGIFCGHKTKNIQERNTEYPKTHECEYFAFISIVPLSSPSCERL